MLRYFFVICAVLLFAATMLAQGTPAQDLPAECGVTCEPNPDSPAYAQAIQSRALPHNARGRMSVFASSAQGTTTTTEVIAGSESYNYGIPLVYLPGRAGLDLNLVLYYNSQIWSVDKVNGQVTFNADHDFPSYGFRLGFGYIEGPFGGITGSSYLLTESDGSKRELRLNSALYVSADSSYIDWNASTRLLRRKDGSTWMYERIGTSTIYRPIKIQDANGNYISITYL